MELIHRNLAIGIHDALQETFFEKNKYADKVIERLLKANKKWGSQDRAVVSEIFYNIIRWKKRLEYYMGEGVNLTISISSLLLIFFGAKPIIKNLKNLTESKSPIFLPNLKRTPFLQKQ
jgi:16S rRNA (cytosine967-C5)-methyltransferase